MLKKLLSFFAFIIIPLSALGAIDPSKLLKPMEAFSPQVVVQDNHTTVQFQIADGYYLYKSKTLIKTQPENLFGTPQYSQGKEKTDDFFGTQEIYLNAAQVILPHRQTLPEKWTITVEFQGCAAVGVCYPPEIATFTINSKTGVFMPDNAAKPKRRASDLFLSQAPPDKGGEPSVFEISRTRLGANLLAFFLAGLGLSFTACMYPLIPIVSATVLGSGKVSKKRALWLSFVYVQGLALTYTAVGVFAGLTGSFLTVILQKPAVVLTAACLLVLLALSMFGLFSLQMPQAVQQFFADKSGKYKGGKALSVFMAGMFSALIIGPCIAPPLAFALGYIGKSGDALLGGLALYALALGTGVPLIAVSVFGAAFLPRAGAWMRVVQIVFGCLILSAAVFLASPYLPKQLILAAYSLILIIPAGLLFVRLKRLSGSTKTVSALFASLLICAGLGVAYYGMQPKTVVAEDNKPPIHHTFTTSSDLKMAIDTAFRDNPQDIVIVDFYADWCISCREMQEKTLNQEKLWQYIDKQRFFTIDVTANTEEQRELLKQYGLFGPPGLFVLTSPDKISEPLIGFAEVDELIEWIEKRK
ncbi:MAG: protein-disulfide reductase DsbD [Neisseriaceae bacterium]|nr:protein-disulfide reductase DsbD [Neisseriaceae bacterium]